MLASREQGKTAIVHIAEGTLVVDATMAQGPVIKKALVSPSPVH